MDSRDFKIEARTRSVNKREIDRQRTFIKSRIDVNFKQGIEPFCEVILKGAIVSFHMHALYSELRHETTVL